MTAIAPDRARHALPPPEAQVARRSWWRDLIGSATAASMIIVVALWVRGGNIQALGGTGATVLTSVGRLAGMIGADLLLIQIVLIARVPWIERQYGQDRLTRWHRVVGFTSINLVLVHVVAITIGYAGTDRSPLLSEAVQLVLTYPGMLLATAGTAALVMVAVTSVRIARARLRYESWHLLHLYAYAGVGLSLPHELWTGADFVATPLARVYWWGVYIAAAACILVYRIGLPLWRTVRHDLRVAAVVPESPGVTSVYLSGRHLHRMRVTSGQFFNWRFLGVPGWTRAHPYSLSAAPRRDRLRITVKDLGDGSRDVTSLRPGARVIAEGPYGRLTGAVRRRRHLTFFACGIGITPIRALLESEFYRPGEAVLIYRVRHPAELTFYRELEQLGRDRGVAIRYLIGPRGDDGSWLPADHHDEAATLRWLAPHVDRSDVYLCGPQPWMDEVDRTLDRIGVPDEHIHREQFSW